MLTLQSDTTEAEAEAHRPSSLESGPSHDPFGLSLVAAPVINRLADDLSGTEISVLITDAEGFVLLGRAPDGQEKTWLESALHRPGRQRDWNYAWTNSLSDAILTGTASVTHGNGHSCDALTRLTIAGVPIRHPRTTQIIGALGLVCDATKAYALLLPMAAQVAREIEQSLLSRRTTSNRVLEEAFLQARRGTRGPLALVSQQALLTNAAADRILRAADRSNLWDFASRTVHAAGTAESELALSDGGVVNVTLEAVSDGHDLAGVLVRVLGSSHPQSSSQDHVTRPGRQTFGWESLTEAEQSVTELVSDGLTNRQVANKLWMSRHTVDAHLRHIFQKLGIKSRVELARIATARTLVTPSLADEAAVG